MYPILFYVGRFPIHAWGVLLMIGFLLGTWRAARVAPRYAIAPEDLWDCALIGLLGGVLGGRLAYVLNPENINGFLHAPLTIFALWNGGMTSFGGLLGGVGAGLLAARTRKIIPPAGTDVSPPQINLLDLGDLAAPSLAIGYFWGRIGCFLNGCCFGGVCHEAWGVRFPGMSEPVHPTELYSAFAAVVIFTVLLVIEKRRAFRGQLLLLFAILYAIYRFVVEFFREGATANPSGIAALTQGQVACLVLALAAGTYYAYRMHAPRHESHGTAPGCRPIGNGIDCLNDKYSLFGH